jgi:two-component system, OmpR family, osmolarity sensor histidine kinase EnvZ
MLTIKRLFPRSLLGRSLLIIVTPLIVVQGISTWIFYDRHWESVTRWLARSLVGEVDTVIHHMRDFPEPQNRAWILENARIRLGLDVRFKPGALLPAGPPPRSSSIPERELIAEMQLRIKRRFTLDTTTYPRQIEIKVQLPGGVLRVLATDKRLSSPTTLIFIAWSSGSAIVLFAVATVFMRNQVRPIRRLASAAESFGKGRDVPNFKPSGAREVRQASSAFLRMRARIKRQIAQRTEMLAGVSHDLRTPITRMKLQLEMLKDREGAAGLRADIAEMEEMLDEYLAFARGEGGEAPVDTDLTALLSEVVRGHQGNGKDVTLDAKGGLTVAVRPTAFKRAVTNLVNNAVAHGQHVKIAAKRSGETVEITVDDDGPGIPRARRREAFKAFARLDPARTPEKGGVGLGLTIARDIMRGHGGEVALEDSPAGGLRARLSLPV